MVSLQYLMTEDVGSAPTSVDSGVTVLLSFRLDGQCIHVTTGRSLLFRLLDGLGRRVSDSVVPCRPWAPAVLTS